MDAPLDQPLYGASLPQAVGRLFRKYFTFTGRASRSEYWWVVLFDFLVYVALGVLALVTGLSGSYVDEAGRNQPGPLITIPLLLLVLWIIGTYIARLALSVRRLHDVNLSGWFVLLNLIPTLGGIAVLVLSVLPPNPAGQRFDRGAVRAADGF